MSFAQNMQIETGVYTTSNSTLSRNLFTDLLLNCYTIDGNLKLWHTPRRHAIVANANKKTLGHIHAMLLIIVNINVDWSLRLSSLVK
jgi:hypothetical protein